MTSGESKPVERPKRRWYQFHLWHLFIFVTVAAIGCSWFGWEMAQTEGRRLAYEQLDMDIYTCDVPSFPWFSSWLYRLLGYESSYDLSFLILNNFASVDDDKLLAIGNFTNLEQLWLNGDISITDRSLDHLKGLKHLRELSLADAPLTAAAVEELRRSLPGCDISWTPPVLNTHGPSSDGVEQTPATIGEFQD